MEFEDVDNFQAPVEVEFPVSKNDHQDDDFSNESEGDWDDNDDMPDDVQIQSFEKRMAADKLSQTLETRPSEKRLEDIGVIKSNRGSMSDVLAGVAHELERNMTIDKLTHDLETRPTENRLEELNVIKGRRSSTLSNALVGTAVALEKQITHDKLAHALEHRPSEQQLEHVGLMKSKRGSMSDVLAATAAQLEKEMKSDAVSATLCKRANDSQSKKRPSDLAPESLPTPPALGKRTSLSNVLAANARELEKQITVDHVSAGLSKRSSQKDLLDRGVLKRPPSESNILAATAVALEKAIASDRVSDTVVLKARNFIGGNESGKDIDTGAGLKQRMNAYMAAVRESNSSSKSPQIGTDIRERMRAYQVAAKSSPTSFQKPAQVFVDSPKVSEVSKVFSEGITSPSSASAVESKLSESPRSGPTLKERLQAYQETAQQGKATSGIVVQEKLDLIPESTPAFEESPAQPGDDQFDQEEQVDYNDTKEQFEDQAEYNETEAQVEKQQPEYYDTEAQFEKMDQSFTTAADDAAFHVVESKQQEELLQEEEAW